MDPTPFFIAILKRLRQIDAGVTVRWSMFLVGCIVFVGPWIQATAETAVIKIMESDSDFKEMKQAVGAIQTSIGNINTTLTINAINAAHDEKDRTEINRKIDLIVDALIKRKAENINAQ